MDKLLESALDGFRAGNDRDQRFRTVFNSCYARVLHFLQNKGMPEPDARDVTLEVLFSIYNSVWQLESAKAFKPRLFAIARNAFANWLDCENLRRRETGPALFHTPDEFDFEGAQVDSRAGMLGRDRTELLREALDQLPPQMRQCVRLRVLEDADYGQIATRLGISVNTVKAHLFQAKRSLRYRLGSLFKEAGNNG